MNSFNGLKILLVVKIFLALVIKDILFLSNKLFIVDKNVKNYIVFCFLCRKVRTQCQVRKLFFYLLLLVSLLKFVEKTMVWK